MFLEAVNGPTGFCGFFKKIKFLFAKVYLGNGDVKIPFILSHDVSPYAEVTHEAMSPTYSKRSPRDLSIQLLSIQKKGDNHVERTHVVCPTHLILPSFLWQRSIKPME